MPNAPDPELNEPESASGLERATGPTARMYHAAATGFTRRKQVSICASSWPDWLVVSKLEFVPGEDRLMRAVQAYGQQLGAEIYFEAASLRAVRVF